MMEYSNERVSGFLEQMAHKAATLRTSVIPNISITTDGVPPKLILKLANERLNMTGPVAHRSHHSHASHHSHHSHCSRTI